MKLTIHTGHNVFFTSDPHFFHTNSISMCNRPFTTVDEMNAGLIANWNSVVRPCDTVFLLGDVSFAKNMERNTLIVAALNGTKHLIRGNHDHQAWEATGLFASIRDLRDITIIDGDTRQAMTLCHFPMVTWNREHYGAWHLHGHCHGLMAIDPKKKRRDVGVDACEYVPVSYHDTKRWMLNETDDRDIATNPLSGM